MIWVDHVAGHYQLTLGGTPRQLPRLGPGARRRPVAAPRRDLRRHHRPLLHRRRPGREPRPSPATSATRTPGGSAPSGLPPRGFFDGIIDDVRIYNRALSAAEIQTDLASSSRTQPGRRRTRRLRAAPGTLTATAGTGQVALAWGAATDNVGVDELRRLPLDERGFTPSTANRIAQPTGTSYTDTGLAPGTYYYKVAAEDAAGTSAQPSNEATATVASPTRRRRRFRSRRPPAGATVCGLVNVTANAADNGCRRRAVQASTARTSAPRTPRPVLGRLGHARRAERLAHADRRRPRRRRQHGDVRVGHGHGRQHRCLALGPARCVRLRRRHRHRRGRLVRATNKTATSSAATWTTAAISAARVALQRHDQRGRPCRRSGPSTRPASPRGLGAASRRPRSTSAWSGSLDAASRRRR